MPPCWKTNSKKKAKTAVLLPRQNTGKGSFLQGVQILPELLSCRFFLESLSKHSVTGRYALLTRGCSKSRLLIQIIQRVFSATQSTW